MLCKRGALIVLEGVDRSGKTTQCVQLTESLNKKGIPAVLIRFPDRTTHTGQLISSYLSNKDCNLHDKAIHLLFSANRWENADKMEKLLKSGTTLIVDRYSYSGIAYSASKKGMDLNWCKMQEIGLPKPDAVYLLTLDNDKVQKRPGFGEERYENNSMQSRVLQIFKTLKDPTWEEIDAGYSIEEVHRVLQNKALKVIESSADKPLAQLTFQNTFYTSFKLFNFIQYILSKLFTLPLKS